MLARRLPPLTIMVLATVLPGAGKQASAASAFGAANATVISPVGIPSVAISIGMPNVVTRTPSSTPGTTGTTGTAAATGQQAPGTMTVGGVAVSADGNLVQFSVAGDTTSSYVVQLAPVSEATTTQAAGSGAAAGATVAGTGSGTGASAQLPNASALILSSQPLMNPGRLSIVLSQAPSDLLPGAVALSVNYN